MKNRIATLCLREIKKNIKRFLYLALLSFLGVAVFIGLMSADSDMMKTLDTYYDKNNVYDIKIISTLGLTNDDVDALDKLDNRFTVYGIHSKDASFKHNNNTIGTIRIMELDSDHNKVLLQKGRLPQNQNEIVIEESILRKTKIQIGDTIELDLDEDDNTVNKKQLKIVGVVICPIYLTNGNGDVSRGNTAIGNGRVNYYSFTIADFFNVDYYTEIYINIANNFETNSDNYNELINNVSEKINEIKEEREKARYDEILQKANNEIDKKESEVLTIFNDAQKELDDVKGQLDNGLYLLSSSEEQLSTLKEVLDNSLVEINDGETKIANAENELYNARVQLDSAVAEINFALANYKLDYNSLLVIKSTIDGKKLNKNEIVSLLPKDLKYYDSIVNIIDYIYDNGYDNLLCNLIEGINRKSIIDIIPKEIENYKEVCDFIRTVDSKKIRKAIIEYLLDSKNTENIKNFLPSDITGYNYLIKAIEKYEITIDEIIQLFDGVEKIRQGNIDYNNGIVQIENSKKALEEGKIQYQKYLNEYNNAVEILQGKKIEYNEGVQLYQTSLDEFNARKLEFDDNIKKTREEINEIETAEWLIYNRKNNSDYISFINSAQSVKNLSGLFPVVFFAVAIFISLLSMSRMAFEDRGEIGTLKSLGYSNMKIRYKYVLYSLMATLFGGILGTIFGFYFIPWFIFEIYKMLFAIPFFEYNINIVPILFGIIISIICICGATIITINSLIKEKTTDLLRPKAPPKGKTVFLEKNKFIWNKLSFSNKVTIRNIFRYKKRIGMTVLGIVGCTVLLLSGYAIKDSIIHVVDAQFIDTFKFDDSIYMNETLSDVQRDEIFNNVHIKEKLYANVSTVTLNEKDITLIVPSDESKLANLITLKDKQTQEDLHLEDNKIIISSKLAKVLKLKPNDDFEFTDSNNVKHNFKISAITQNYIKDYIYMNKSSYESSIGEYKTNIAYIKYDNLEIENEITAQLLENKDILGISSNYIAIDNLNNIFTSLDAVVLILVVFAGALAFVVLYNLSYINISERQREIATLKVLGFNHKEVDGYIIKEELIITLIGIIIGLIIGTWFSMLIVETIEIDMAEFIKKITPLSYLKTFGFMILFTMIVNIGVHFVLKKIDMIESLKSVE